MSDLTIEDAKIIALLQQKNFDGLALLIDVYGSIIILNIRSILNHPAENSYIKEVENEIFYRIWQKINTFDQTKSSLKTWITHIARNLAIDKKRKIIKDLQIMPQLHENEAVEDQYFEKENFLNLLSDLSKEDQLIFLKFYFYQDAPDDIAQDLNVSTDIIYNHLSRGRKKLKDLWQGQQTN